MRNILVPTDYSANSDNAIHYAVQLAKKFDAKLSLMHIYQVPIMAEITDTMDENLKSVSDFYEHQLLKSNPLIKELCKSNELEVECIVTEGEVPDRIINDSSDYDLIIMGTQGAASDHYSPLFGSITSNVVRKGKSTVLAVPEGTSYKPIENILFAMDFEDIHPENINIIRSIAEKFDANITIIHIRENGKDNDHHKEVFKQTQKMLSDYDFINFVFYKGTDVLNTLNDYIFQHKYDMLAMLPRQKHMLDHSFRQSNTLKMTALTSIPLLAIHE